MDRQIRRGLAIFYSLSAFPFSLPAHTTHRTMLLYININVYVYIYIYMCMCIFNGGRNSETEKGNSVHHYS